jgi:replicative DNA helicase
MVITLTPAEQMQRKRENIIWNEREVIGQMCVKGTINQALRSGIVPEDFNLALTRKIYTEILAIADRRGKFEAIDLLRDDKIERNKELLNIMNDCLSTNLDVKCNWIVKLSMEKSKHGKVHKQRYKSS